MKSFIGHLGKVEAEIVGDAIVSLKEASSVVMNETIFEQMVEYGDVLSRAVINLKGAREVFNIGLEWLQKNGFVVIGEIEISSTPKFDDFLS